MTVHTLVGVRVTQPRRTAMTKSADTDIQTSEQEYNDVTVSSR